MGNKDTTTYTCGRLAQQPATAIYFNRIARSSDRESEENFHPKLEVKQKEELLSHS